MNDVKTNDQPGMGSLVQGIVNDIGELIKHEVRFARAEIQSDLGKTKTAAALLFAGVAAGFIGLLLLSLMAVHGLHYATLPADADFPKAGIPLWGAYGIVGGVIFVAGAILTWLGVDRFNRFNPLPDKTVESVQENVSWIANQTANSK